MHSKSYRVVTVCEQYGLNVNLRNCVVIKISYKTGDVGNIKCNNNHDVKKWRTLSILGSKIVTMEVLKSQRMRNVGKFYYLSRCLL